MSYVAPSLFDSGKLVVLEKPGKPGRARKQQTAKQKERLSWGPPGCRYCSLNRAKVNKVIGLERIKGRRIMLWGQAPGRKENDEGLEFVGPAGEWLWEELGRFKIERKDCDIQNVCRCRPTKISDHGNRIDAEPSEEQLFHCSIFNDQAIEKNDGKAVVHLVFGKVAVKALLGKEYKGDKPVYWSEKLQGMVVVCDHPSYFVRKNYPEWRLYEFRDRIRAAKAFLSAPGRYGYIKAQDYRNVTTAKNAAWLKTKLREVAAQGQRISVDIEEGLDDQGNSILLMIGFSWDLGFKTKSVPNEPDTIGTLPKAHARCLVLDHPENNASAEDREACWQTARDILADPKIRKVLHFGSSDVRGLRRYGLRVKGYDFDTFYAAYFRWPHKAKYGLGEMSVFAFPEFAGYKSIIDQHFKPGEDRNYASIPLSTLSLYNCADADLTKRLEHKTNPKGQKTRALLKVYISAAFVVDAMEKKGPVLDTVYMDQLGDVIPRQVERLGEKLRVMAGDPDFNPNTPADVAKVIYDKLKLPVLDKDRPRTTAEDIMSLLAQRHEFPRLVLEYRKYFKMDSTYLKGYKKSADLNGGELRTRWHLAGTATGRMRSGGKEDGADGIVNFQNLHGSPLLQNLLISDKNWRLVLDKKQDWDRLRRLRAIFALDYSQIEIRVLAEASRDPLLISMFQRAAEAENPDDPWADVHCLVGHSLTGWDPAKIKEDKVTRTMIKQLHFGIVYGMSEESAYQDALSKGVKIKRQAFGELYRAYFKKYKGVAAYIAAQRDHVERYGWTDTLFGFRREIGSWDESRHTFWGNQAVNSPIQGSAHQLVLMAMVNLHEKPKTYSLLQDVVMEVHDALYFFGETEDLPEMYAQGKHLLEHSVPEYVTKNFGFTLSVPLACEAEAMYRMGAKVGYRGEEGPVFIDNWRRKNEETNAKMEKEFGLVAAA
jgi:uracil-DNA glycosylase family 4